MTTCKFWLTVSILGILTLGLSLGTFQTGDSSGGDEDGESAFAMSATQVQSWLLRS